MKTILTLLLAVLALPVLSQNIGYAPSTQINAFMPAKPKDTIIKINPYIQPSKPSIQPRIKKWQPDTTEQKSTYKDLQRLLEGLRDSRLPIDRMPNAIRVDPTRSTDIFVGNNGQGFDIYESKLDRMPILKPDSSNAAMRAKIFNGTIQPGNTSRVRIIPAPGN